MKKCKIFSIIVVILSLLTLLMVQIGWTTVKTHTAEEAAKTKVVQTYMTIPLHFIKNEGQVDNEVKFYEKGSGLSTFFTQQGIYLTLRNDENIATVQLIPVNAKNKPEIIGEELSEGKVNYFIGNDKKKWKTNIPTYKALRYKNIYENIDIKFYGCKSQFEYDIIVKPNGDPSKVKFFYEGIDNLKITNEGTLVVDVKGIKLIHKKPYIYQEIDGERIEIDGIFKLYEKNTYGFKVASYNREYPLIIDPVIIYSTYLGGNNVDEGYSISVDGSGNAYLTGKTYSTDFPTQSPIQINRDGFYDAFVTKINATGDALVYSTYLGGNASDYGNAIAVDGSGNAYLTGETGSIDFPTQNPIQTNNGGTSDAFVTKINATGDALVYSTYLGGGLNDRGKDIALENQGNAYITGYTRSPDFPTKNPLKQWGGYGDVFVTKINATGDALIYSTYLGGNVYDYSNAIAVDGSGNTYITGYTESGDFPLQNPLKPNRDGFYDAFVTKINATGDALVYSTYLGGNASDYGNDIAVDGLGNAYLTGETESTDFQTQNPMQTSRKGDSDAFVTKINATGDVLVYSTYLGGNASDYGNAIAVDGLGNVYITGGTSSTDFPTQIPLQANYAGGVTDAYVTKINANGDALVYSTFLGGDASDVGNAIVLDGSGNAYLTGETYSSTSSSGFPTKNPIQINNGGLLDAFATKISDNNPPSKPELVYPANSQSGLGTEVTFIWKKSTDPDGDAITYNLYVCDEQNFIGCNPIQTASLYEKKYFFTGIGGLTGLLFVGIIFLGGISKRRKIQFLIAVILITSMLFISCGGGDGGDDKSGPPVAEDEISYTLSGFAGGTTYYWKVLADDNEEGKTESDIWNFTTE